MSILNICKGVCKQHEIYRVCKGCYRTKLEIAKWHTATDTEKIIIINSADTKKKIYGEINEL